MLNVSELTNEQIREQLLLRGHGVGPIVESTRNVYENKLRRLLEEDRKSGEASVNKQSPKKAALDTANTGKNYEAPPKNAQSSSHSPQKSRTPARETHANDALEVPLPPSPPKFDSSSKSATYDASQMSGTTSYDMASNRTLQPNYFPSFLDDRSSKSSQHEINSAPPISHIYLNFSNRDVGNNSDEDDVVNAGAAIGSKQIPKFYPSLPKINSTPLRIAPATRFTSLRDDDSVMRGLQQNDSDDELRGEESSRFLSSTSNINKSGYEYSGRYDQGKNVMAASSTVRRGFSNMFSDQDSYGSFGRYMDYPGHSQTIPEKSYTKIIYALLFITIISVFTFFLIQNYAALEQGEANKEEL